MRREEEEEEERGRGEGRGVSRSANSEEEKNFYKKTKSVWMEDGEICECFFVVVFLECK